MRAVTIEIDSVNSIAQTLRPGHRVDLFLLSKANKPKDKEVPELALNQATLFMQNLAVLATGQEFQDIASGNSERVQKMVRPGEVEGAREKGFDTVTVLVSPKEAARLLIGQKLGTFRVALRGSKDLTPVAMRSVTGGDVLPMGGELRNGVEFIVGGKSGGNATVPSTLVASGLPPQNTNAPGSAREPEIRNAVRETLQQIGTPPRRVSDANGNRPEPVADKNR
ncbi:MAG: Flp pilus assembly protein CpaB, partial [Stenotrophomonas sp.]|nr:Flp pilus assembly protein CpaB [Stenotrophomonas sp.]